MNVFVLGYGPMGLALTRGVLACPDIARIVGVFPWSRHAQERNLAQEQSENHFRWFVQRQGLPIVQAPGVNHYRFIQLLSELQPDIVLVGSWGEIFKSHVLALPGIDFINCHPSCLPKHRGANPYIGAILAGDTHSGITFHRIDEGIDTGPILLQAQLALTPYETGESLRNRCAALAEETVPELLRQISEKTLNPQPQTGEGGYDKISPDLGWIDWQAPPDAIERKIRALYPWFDNLALLGRHTIGFGFGRLVANSNAMQDIIPGSIIRQASEGIYVTTMDPAWHLLLEKPSIYGVPRLLSPLFARMLLRPMRRFTAVPQSNSEMLLQECFRTEQ